MFGAAVVSCECSPVHQVRDAVLYTDFTDQLMKKADAEGLESAAGAEVPVAGLGLQLGH